MKEIKPRKYTEIAGMTPDYFKVRDFLMERGHSEFTYGRWDWMVTHPNLDKDRLSRIGLWEDGGRLVALAVYDCQPGETYLVTLAGYEHLLPDMIEYAGRELCVDEYFSLVIPDDRFEYQTAAARAGYVASPEKEFEAAFFPRLTSMDYSLPDGFTITDFKTTPDMYQYGKVLWNGFDHDGVFDPDDEDTEIGKASMFRPNVDLSLKIAAVSPEGEFAAYCGMWYDEKSDYAVIEPVACDPKFRRRGLARAAVLEGIKRCCERGAKYAVVGSSQQFYYSIGLRPFMTSTKWIKAANKL